MAARQEGRAIDYQEVVDFCRRAMAARRGVLLIEGIGGIMVPLDDRHTVLDWMSVAAHPDRAGGRQLCGHHEPHLDGARGAGAA